MWIASLPRILKVSTCTSVKGRAIRKNSHLLNLSPRPFLSVCLPLRSGMPWEFCLDKERSPCHPWKGVVISESIAGAGREGSTLGFSLFQLLKLEFHKSKNLLTAINLAERTAQNWSSKNIVEWLNRWIKKSVNEINERWMFSICSRKHRKV